MMMIKKWWAIGVFKMITNCDEWGEIHTLKCSRKNVVDMQKQTHTTKAIFKRDEDKIGAEVEE